jgi:hypothetical protein
VSHCHLIDRSPSLYRVVTLFASRSAQTASSRLMSAMAFASLVLASDMSATSACTDTDVRLGSHPAGGSQRVEARASLVAKLLLDGDDLGAVSLLDRQGTACLELLLDRSEALQAEVQVGLRGAVSQAVLRIATEHSDEHIPFFFVSSITSSALIFSPWSSSLLVITLKIDSSLFISMETAPLSVGGRLFSWSAISAVFEFLRRRYPAAEVI